MEENLPREALINMHNNIYNLDVKESLGLTFLSFITFYLNNGIIGGYYVPEKNKVIIHSEKNLQIVTKINPNFDKMVNYQDFTFTHELLHMS